MSTVYRCLAASLAAAALYLLAIPATITPAAARGDVVAFNGDVSPGTIVVRTNERRLYLVLGQGRALAYPVGVGRAGRQWAGRAVHRQQARSPGVGAAARHQARTSEACRTSFPAARRTIRWASRR